MVFIKISRKIPYLRSWMCARPEWRRPRQLRFCLRRDRDDTKRRYVSRPETPFLPSTVKCNGFSRQTLHKDTAVCPGRLGTLYKTVGTWKRILKSFSCAATWKKKTWQMYDWLGGDGYKYDFEGTSSRLDDIIVVSCVASSQQNADACGITEFMPLIYSDAAVRYSIPNLDNTRVKVCNTLFTNEN